MHAEWLFSARKCTGRLWATDISTQKDGGAQEVNLRGELS